MSIDDKVIKDWCRDMMERLRKENAMLSALLSDRTLESRAAWVGINERQAKQLAKAVEALREIEDCLGSDPDEPHRDCVEHARAVLKELEKWMIGL